MRRAIIPMLACLLGCDAEPNESVDSATDIVFRLLEGADTPSPALPMDLDQPADGVCGGAWETKNVAMGCGSCTISSPGPSRPGDKIKVYKRWCWTGVGCSGCEDWSYIGSVCYDTCQ